MTEKESVDLEVQVSNMLMFILGAMFGVVLVCCVTVSKESDERNELLNMLSERSAELAKYKAKYEELYLELLFEGFDEQEKENA